MLLAGLRHGAFCVEFDDNVVYMHIAAQKKNVAVNRNFLKQLCQIFTDFDTFTSAKKRGSAFIIS